MFNFWKGIEKNGKIIITLGIIEYFILCLLIGVGAVAVIGSILGVLI